MPISGRDNWQAGRDESFDIMPGADRQEGIVLDIDDDQSLQLPVPPPSWPTETDQDNTQANE